MPKTGIRSGRAPFFVVVFCLLSAFLAPPPARASNSGLLWGRVVDADGRPLSDATVAAAGLDVEEQAVVTSDEDGWFAFVGLRPGLYAVRARAFGHSETVRERVVVDPSGRVAVTLTLVKIGAAPGSSTVREDILPGARVVIPAAQIERLPTGHSINSLIENQTTGATSDRIDVGGLWEAVPTLFGSRGAASWTQNVFLIDGADVTEPYFGGTPLVVPDIYALDSFCLTDAASPIQSLTPASTVDLSPREGGSVFRGGIRGFYLDKTFASSNITPALREEGLTESDTFNRLMDVQLHLSGPLFGGRWRYFTSWSSYSTARDLAEFDPLDESRLASGLVHLGRDGERRRLRLFWTGRLADHSSYGAGRNIPLEATVKREEVRNFFQLVSESRPGERRANRYGLGLALAGWSDGLQAGASGVQRLEPFRNLPAGTASATGDEKRVLASAFFEGRSFFRNIARTRHLFEYGARAQYAAAESEATVPGNLRLHYLEGRPYEALLFESPFRHREQAASLDAWVQDTVTLPGGAALTVGLHGVGTHGRGGGGTIDRVAFSPRFTLRIPLSKTRTSDLRVTIGRYFWTLPLSWLTWGDPDAPGARAFAWTDPNGDGEWSEDERGPLLRREGPRYGQISEDLLLPRTDELSASFTHDLGRGWMMSLVGTLRKTGNLVETVNTGVPFTSYTPLAYEDIGDDRIPGSSDDLTFTLFDQRAETLGRDFYLLTNPGLGSRKSTYAGLDFVLFKRPTDASLFFLAMTATRAFQTNGPGNTAWENDEGIIGPLYDNPNAGINAEGRPRFDRAYTIRLGLSHELPLGTRAGLVLKYYDGQPFARMIVVEGLNQGPVLVQAHARGVARYEFNLTADLRLEKEIRLSFGAVRLLFDVFNFLNLHQATEESEWTRPEFPLRYATDIQSPRVFRLGFGFDF